MDPEQSADLSEKRAALEKLKSIDKEVKTQGDMLVRLEAKIADLTGIPEEHYIEPFNTYKEIEDILSRHISKLEISVANHDTYWKSYSATADYLRKAKVELQAFSDCNGEQSDVKRKLDGIESFCDKLSGGII